MTGARPAVGPAPGGAARLRRRAAQLGVGDGEALEVLQRLPAAAGQGAAALGWWERRATRALDAYAARKRAVARLARQGRL
jgi:hypothetical protein